MTVGGKLLSRGISRRLRKIDSATNCEIAVVVESCPTRRRGIHVSSHPFDCLVSVVSECDCYWHFWRVHDYQYCGRSAKRSLSVKSPLLIRLNERV